MMHAHISRRPRHGRHLELMLLLILQAVFQLLQGLLIFLSYRQPTYLRFRGKQNGCSRIQATRGQALKWDLYQLTSLKPYQRGGGGY